MLLSWLLGTQLQLWLLLVVIVCLFLRRQVCYLLFQLPRHWLRRRFVRWQLLQENVSKFAVLFLGHFVIANQLELDQVRIL